jgi:hypothetical protein
VRLDEDAVDLLQVGGAALVADGFEQGAEAEVFGAAQEALAGAHDQGEGAGREGVVAQAAAVELVEDEGFDGAGGQALEDDRVGDARADLFAAPPEIGRPRGSPLAVLGAAPSPRCAFRLR